jgi:hypothetical protein
MRTIEEFMQDNDLELIDVVMKVGHIATNLEQSVQLYIRGSDDNELTEEEIDELIYSDDNIIDMMIQSSDNTLVDIAESFRDLQGTLHKRMCDAYGV